MKNIIALFLLLSTISCVSTKFNRDKAPDDFSKIRAGEKYKIYDLENRKTMIHVTSVVKDSILGTFNNQRISVAKNDIKSIKKNQTAATVILIGTSTAVIIVSALVGKGIKDTSESLGKVLTPP